MTDKLGPLIGQGRAAEVYAWGEDQVVKLFFTSAPRESVERQVQVSSIAHKAGLPTPAVGEVIEIAGRYGMVFDRIHGTTMLADMTPQFWRFGGYARLMAELHVQVHSRQGIGMPLLKSGLEDAIGSRPGVPNHVRAGALAVLRRLPDGDAIIHGDFHPENIIMSSRGAVIIDWSNGHCGNPLADVAQTWLTLCMGALLPRTAMKWLIQVLRHRFFAVYVNHYQQRRPFSEDEFAAWQVVMLALRLVEDIPEERAALLALLDERMGR